MTRRIAIIGLGAMGARMAGRLLAADHPVTVWNRSPGPVAELVRRGARAADSPRDAVADADIVIAMVFDDAAAERVWLDPADGALAGMRPGALGIESSTLSPALVRRLHAAAAGRGLSFLDAPVAGSRPQAEAGQLIFLVGGAAADLAMATPVLGVLGSVMHHVGGPGAGSVAKLMVNTLFGVQLAVLGELTGLAERLAPDLGTSAERLLSAVAATPVASPAVKVAGEAMLARRFAPAAPIDLIAKDLGLAVALGAELGQTVPMTAAGRDAYRAASAAGFGGDNVTAIVRRYLP